MKKYRFNNENWENILSKFHLTGNHKHLFSQEIYLKLLSESKFGLCLRGYGSKCHRDIELMALGTVPIFTPEVSIDYNDPLIENYHYIKIKANQAIVKVLCRYIWSESFIVCLYTQLLIFA